MQFRQQPMLSSYQLLMPFRYFHGANLDDIIKGFRFINVISLTMIYLLIFWKVENCSPCSQYHYKQCQYVYRFCNHLGSMVLQMPRPKAHSFHRLPSLRCPWQAELQQASLALDKLSSGQACLEPDCCVTLNKTATTGAFSATTALSDYKEWSSLDSGSPATAVARKLLWWPNRAFYPCSPVL